MVAIKGKKLPKIVTIGGGTGHFVLLSGLKDEAVDIAAIVSMADDGGSTGLLRDEMGVLPPGDVRQCLAALSEESDLLRALFSYRFTTAGLAGHSFGNLFLSALEKISGSFDAAVAEASRVLHVKGDVIPVTEGDMRLVIERNDGDLLMGERHLDDNDHLRTVGVKQVHLAHPVVANPRAIEALALADVIVLGPGDLYGSLLPPLLVPGVCEAIVSSKAILVYVANLTNKRGQTDAFTVQSYVEVINRYLGTERIDRVLINNTMPSKALVARYEKQEGKGMIVANDTATTGYVPLYDDLLAQDPHESHNGDQFSHTRSFIRHDSHKLAHAIVRLVTGR